MDVEQLVERYLPLAAKEAHRAAQIVGYRYFDDLLAEARVALVKAAQASDRAGPLSFFDFATWRIRRATSQAMWRIIRTGRRELALEDVYGPMVEGEDDAPPGDPPDLGRSPEEQVIARLTAERMLDRLAPRQRQIIWHLMNGRTLEDVGDSLGVSRQTVHNVARDALEVLRSIFGGSLDSRRGSA
ncbi:MAG TPA: sigma-70 family RNA polymerase sigma factor [Candidatus Polarisedimenticolaceae bacterium]|nr:sigma-70 family RNA polymerase sigma factor [Candidatus Polarisedimenticolaceae bacterium]